MRRVAAMKHEGIAVRVAEAGDMTDAGIDDLVVELDAGGLKLPFGLLHVRDAERDRHRVRLRLEIGAHGFRRNERDRDVPRFVLDPPRARVRAACEPERRAVEIVSALEVLNRDADEVDAFCVDQPTEPSICSWIKRFISTAYSSGSSFVIGSTKPDTISADASGSVSPRDIR